MKKLIKNCSDRKINMIFIFLFSLITQELHVRIIKYTFFCYQNPPLFIYFFRSRIHHYLYFIHEIVLKRKLKYKHEIYEFEQKTYI